MPLIEAVALRKQFRTAAAAPGVLGALRHLVAPTWREKEAVRDLDLLVEAGESVAYVGPNGAGKSTTVKMLSGILVPTSGNLTVAGRIPHRERIAHAASIGVVFGQRTQLQLDLTVADSLALQRTIYDIEPARWQANRDAFVELLGLDEFLHQTARRLSLGQRMRADLAMALLHDPPVVFLDEPTIGLDLTAKERIRGFLKTLNRERGTTLMLTTHDLGDIEELCPRLVIIDQGRKIFDGGQQEMKDRFARERAIVFHLERPAVGLAEGLARFPGLTIESADAAPGSGPTATVRFDRFEYQAGTLTRAVMDLAAVVDFHLEEPSIEQVIRKVYAGTLAGMTPVAPVTAVGSGMP